MPVVAWRVLSGLSVPVAWRVPIHMVLAATAACCEIAGSSVIRPGTGRPAPDCAAVAVPVVGVDLGVQSWRVCCRPGGSGPASAGAGCGRGIAAAGDGLRRRRRTRGDGYDVGAVPDSLHFTGVFRPARDLARRFAPRLRGGIFFCVCGGCSGRRAMAGHAAPDRDLRRLHLPGELHAQFHCRQQGHDLGHSGRQGRLHEGPFPFHGSDYRSPDRGIFLSQALRPARAPGIPAHYTVNRRRAPSRGLLAGHNLDRAGQPDLRDLLSDPAAAGSAAVGAG
jgi:hypothetical protein